MANIFIIGLNSKTGGGKVIFDNYLELLKVINSHHNYFVLTPKKDEYVNFKTDFIKILDVHWLFNNNFFFHLLYFFVFPRIFKQE